MRASRKRCRLPPADPELLEWDSEFWGKRIGRVGGGSLDAGRVNAWASENGVECIYYLAPADDPAAVHDAEEAGFRLMDVRVELARDADVGALPAGVREARQGDAAVLRTIAASSHGATRFYADPNFPDARCDELYETWIRRSLEGWADGVLVAEAGGRPAGYVSCHVDGRTGSIGLIAVAETARGGGLGVDLSRAAVAWCAARGVARMTVVTQGRNVAALRTFQRAGFLVSTLELWFHKWFPR